jgi:hypothetical protein
MSGRSDIGGLQSVREPGEQTVGLSRQETAHDTFGRLLYWARTDFDCAGQGHDGGRPCWSKCPAVGDPAQSFGQAFDVIGDGAWWFECGDALEEGVPSDLDTPGRTDGVPVDSVNQDARVVDVVCPRADREVRQDVPDFLRGSRDDAGTGDVHRFTVRTVGPRAGTLACLSLKSRYEVGISG